MSVLERALGHFEARPRFEVDCPEWGAVVFFKVPNLATFAKVQADAKNAVEMTARLVARCAEHEDGKRMFGDLDYKDLMTRTDPAVVRRIADAIMARSNLAGGDADVLDAEKN